MTLAIHSVLFLDELAAFIAPVLDGVASTVVEKAPCTNEECIGSRMTPR